MTKYNPQLSREAEQLRRIMLQMGKGIAYYDIATGTLSFPPVQKKLRYLSHTTEHFPESFFARQPDGFPPATLETLRQFYDSIRRGEPSGSCEYRLVTSEGVERWEQVEFSTVFDPDGKPLWAVLAIEDITARHAQSKELQRLKYNEHLLRLTVQHSDRVLCYYDIPTQTAQIWDEENCAKCQLPHLCEKSFQQILGIGSILPESEHAWTQMFRDIHKGTPKGSARVRLKTIKGERRWFDLRYSTVFDEENAPVSALISHKDITELHEHELAYLRLAQTVTNSKNHLGTLEVDLTTDSIDRQGGKMNPPRMQATGLSFSAFSDQMVSLKMLEEDQAAGAQFFSRDHLLSQYAEGNRRLRREWQMKLADNSLAWIHTVAELMADPYTNHIKAFFRMSDITDEKQAQIDMLHRSERDGMTGLLNRTTTEALIREALLDRAHPGILVLLDLDDLKSINDVFGHKEGDRAIIGISDTLKSHFRESDILGRIGGDEFMLYLPGSAINSDSIAVSLASLLRKLAGIPIGDDDQLRIHCSIGCAIHSPTADTLEVLFKQADTALYHVKRNGKNNYAFFEPDMNRADYQFQAQRLLSIQSTKKFDLTEIQHLLSAISTFYPLVLSMNLSTNDYHLLDEINGGVFSKLPPFGIMDEFVELTLSLIHPDDTAEYVKKLSRKALLEAYANGEQSVRHYFRFRHKTGPLWVEASAIFYTNEKGDVCDFTLVRWADERAYELEQLWLQKVLELTVASVFEYIALIDIGSSEYTIYGNEQNIQAIPKHGSFDTLTQYFRDHVIAPGKRDAYDQAAGLHTILEQMTGTDAPYIYHYQAPDGPREAAFYWFEPTHSQILMTVQRYHAS